MISLWAFHATVLLCNWALVSASMLTPLRDDGSLRIFKEPLNEFEYAVKRHDGVGAHKDDAESKDRRSSSASSSFIRYGRSQYAIADGSSENGDADSKVSRHPRWKPADIVIRFGRSGFKTAANGEQLKRGRNDLNFIRFGRNVQIVPADLDLSAICAALTTSVAVDDAELHPDVARLLRICNSLNRITGEISLDVYQDRVGSSRHE